MIRALVLLFLLGGCRYDLGVCDFEHVALSPDCRDETVRVQVGYNQWTDYAMTFCDVPAGCFRMGSPDEEPCREVNGLSETRHTVTLTHRFRVASTEVTIAWFKLLLSGIAQLDPPASTPCKGEAECPRQEVTWHHAVAFCNALSRRLGGQTCYEEGTPGPSCTHVAGSNTCAGSDAMAGCVGGQCVRHQLKTELQAPRGSIYDCTGYRLPTEAEWEHAYRAGSTTAFYSGPVTSCGGTDPALDRIARYGKDLETAPAQVGTAGESNNLGLFDMAGNLFEWTHDGATADLGPQPRTDPVAPDVENRLVRGGRMDGYAPQFMRAAYRDRYGLWRKHNRLGFRCVQTVFEP